MEYENRQQVEVAGLLGAGHTLLKINGERACITRQLNSYFLCCKEEDAGIAEHHKNDGFWESWITLWMSKNVNPNSVCIDGGVNYGYYSFFLANHGCKVIGIEPNSKIIPFIVKSALLNNCADRFTLINRAISNRDNETIRLGILPSTLNSTVVKRDDLIDSFEVKTVTLNSVAKQFGKIDFVKLDIEGAEQMAWHGMQVLLEENTDCVVLMEFVKEHYPQSGKLFFAELSKKCNIAYVDFSGNEQSIGYDFIKKDSEDLRMLVIRRKDKFKKKSQNN